MALTSMAFGSEVAQGVDEYEKKGSLPPFRARMHIFSTWKVFACAIQAATVVGMVAMERIIVASHWSSPSENWSMRVTLLVIPTLAERFWKSVIYFWNPPSMIPSGHLKDFWESLVSLKRVVALVLKGKKVELKFSTNLSKVFLVAATAVLAILSYHISEKGIPFPLLISLSIVVIFRSSVL